VRGIENRSGGVVLGYSLVSLGSGSKRFLGRSTEGFESRSFAELTPGRDKVSRPYPAHVFLSFLRPTCVSVQKGLQSRSVYARKVEIAPIRLVPSQFVVLLHREFSGTVPKGDSSLG
jgi:hypothetical protein